MNREELLKRIYDVEEHVKSMRGWLHQHPELSDKEFETSKYLLAEVERIGLPVTMIDHVSFYVTLDTGRPGHVVGIRADMDALPMEESENNLIGSKKWVSLNKEASHTCGHDAHMAMLIGTMEVLNSIKDELSGKIYFLFEQGEEIGTGIKAMLDAIKDLGIEAIYATHLKSNIPTGLLCLEEGPKMAGAVVVEFEVKGKGGHGSRPDLSINPLFATAQVLTALGTAWSNRINVEETVTLGLTQIHGGSLNNIIPDSCYVGGSLRYYNRAEADHAVEVLKNTIIHTAKAHYCEADVSKIRIGTTPVINDAKVSAIVEKTVESLIPGHLVKGVKWYASESFAQYSKIAPICFAFLGIANEALGSGAEHHNVCFDVDEDAFKYGVAGAVSFAVGYLEL